MNEHLQRVWGKIQEWRGERPGKVNAGSAPDSKVFYEDSQYKKYFERNIWPGLSASHQNEYFNCCAFCSALKKSTCHAHCFTCSKKAYDECSVLLPGTFSFRGLYLDSSGNELIPWIFKTPCTGFEQLSRKQYFRNFISPELSITVENYEALEGIFFGISRGKRPCHICASVNMDIYNSCSSGDRLIENIPCRRIIEEMKQEYQVIQGMVRNID